MITPTRFEVSCVGWDCDPDRYPYAPVWTKPLVVEARSVREASAKARAAGWNPAYGKGNWWCPRHAAMADQQTVAKAQ